MNTFSDVDCPSAHPALRVALVVATAGRPEVLQKVSRHWLTQTRKPDRIIVSAPGPADVAGLPAGIEVILGQRGSCVQRNVALDRVAAECALVIFLDDDFVPSVRFVEAATTLFTARSDVMVASGNLLADGINGPGIAYEAAAVCVAEHDRHVRPPA